MKLVVFVSLFFYSNIIYSAWPQEAFDFAKMYKTQFSNPYVLAARNACLPADQRYNYEDLTEQIIDYKFAIDSIAKRSLEIKVLKNNKGPHVMAIFVGSFVNTDDYQPRYLSSIFYSLGYSVIIFPNPLGTDYIKSKIGAAPISPDHEAKQYYQALVEIHKSEKFGDVSLFGVSYGAALAALVARNGATEKTIPIKKVIAISPALELGVAYEKIDRFIADFPSRLRKGKIVSYLPSMLYACTSRFQKNPDEDTIKKIKEFMTYVFFVRSLKESTLLYDEMSNQNLVPGRELRNLSKAYKRWAAQLDFKSYFSMYHKKSEMWVGSNQDNLLKIMAEIEEHGIESMALTTTDDFLNDQDSWPLNDSRVIILDGGGHYGFSEDHWYSDFLRSVFQLKNLR